MAMDRDLGGRQALPAINLEPLCRVDAELAEVIPLLNTPSGTRRILEVLSLHLSGERVVARLKGRAAADWLTISPRGDIGTLDVRCTLETHDGAVIFMQYGGRARIAPTPNGAHQLYVAPRFDTGDERYAWLNGVQAIGKAVQPTGSKYISYVFCEIE
jgi:hypothetical protein